uniref:Kynurenine 3-monooxygenase n=2 Tax=Cacopsylla melanoneura TaxID=428564 RepID=A0A8D9EL61_9HEMI
MKSKSEKSVVIVGGGLVGSMAACMFARKQYKIDIYEARGDMRQSNISAGKSINLALSVRGREALRRIGLEEKLLSHGIPMRARMIHTVDGKLNQIPYDPVHNQCIYSVSRKFLNEALLTELEQYPNCSIHFHHKMTKLDVDSGNLTFSKKSGDEAMIEVNASEQQLIIGADGAHSGVRKCLMSQPRFDFSQTYIEHGYLELCIPPSDDGNYQMEPNFLHIWPRGTFMMIALPNQDRSWTVTLFMPFDNFAQLQTPEKLVDFFNTTFPDSVPLIGVDKLVKDFFSRKASPLISIKCHPYHKNDKILILGDAAHAMVPFYGQGMNAGFEDCCVLDDLMDELEEDFALVLPKFTEVRHTDAQMICDLAMYNYIEMRDLVTKSSFLWRKRLDSFLFSIFPNFWVPLYNAVTFSRLPYRVCVQHKEFQDKIIRSVVTGSCIVLGLMILYLIGFIFFE